MFIVWLNLAVTVAGLIAVVARAQRAKGLLIVGMGLLLISSLPTLMFVTHIVSPLDNYSQYRTLSVIGGLAGVVGLACLVIGAINAGSQPAPAPFAHLQQYPGQSPWGPNQSQPTWGANQPTQPQQQPWGSGASQPTGQPWPGQSQDPYQQSSWNLAAGGSNQQSWGPANSNGPGNAGPGNVGQGNVGPGNVGPGGAGQAGAGQQPWGPS